MVPPVVLDSADEEELAAAIRRTIQDESLYEWVDAPLTDSDSVHLETELERISTGENSELIFSFVILIGNSYFDSSRQKSPPELLSEVNSQLEELEANLEGIVSKSLQRPCTLSFERSDSYNGEDTAYVDSVIYTIS